MADSAVKSISVFPLSIPMRQKVDHATSQRQLADPVVFSVELNSHVVGYGETLPRAYVTGETVASVIEAIADSYAPVLLETFVERQRFRGTCYRAANWLHVGRTQGRGKLDPHRYALPVKEIFLYPLRKHFRRQLCQLP